MARKKNVEKVSMVDNERNEEVTKFMLTGNELLEEMLSDTNLGLAMTKVIRNKGASGVDGMEVIELREYLDEHLEEIKEQIRNKTYRPKPVRRVEIPKDNGGVRNLGVPTVVDRFIQQAITQVLTPIYEPLFSDKSYGFRPGRNCEMAIVKALEFMNDGYEWVVDLDLEKFFDNVNHDKLITLVMRDVKCGEIVSLIRKYLVSGVMIDDEYRETVIGTPQGGDISPLLSNIMLNELDKELEARGLNFTRYADDCIILVRSGKAADRVMEHISKFIEKKLGLKVNMTKSKISKPNDIKYLGFGFYYDCHCGLWKAKPHQISIDKLKKKLKQLTKRNWSIPLERRLVKIRQLVVGWVRYFRKGNFKGVCDKLDSWLRTRIRVILWKQWKVPQARRKHMLELLGPGNEEKAYMWSYSRKGYIRCARTFLQTVLTNKILHKKYGLVSLLDQYVLIHKS